MIHVKRGACEGREKYPAHLQDAMDYAVRRTEADGRGRAVFVGAEEDDPSVWVRLHGEIGPAGGVVFATVERQ